MQSMWSHVIHFLSSEWLTVNMTGYRREQLVVAVHQWQNKSLASAFLGWRDHVVTTSSHTVKVRLLSVLSASR